MMTEQNFLLTLSDIAFECHFSRNSVSAISITTVAIKFEFRTHQSHSIEMITIFGPLKPIQNVSRIDFD